jgi:hypothetical protein
MMSRTGCQYRSESIQKKRSETRSTKNLNNFHAPRGFFRSFQEATSTFKIQMYHHHSLSSFIHIMRERIFKNTLEEYQVCEGEEQNFSHLKPKLVDFISPLLFSFLLSNINTKKLSKNE